MHLLSNTSQPSERNTAVLEIRRLRAEQGHRSPKDAVPIRDISRWGLYPFPVSELCRSACPVCNSDIVDASCQRFRPPLLLLLPPVSRFAES